MAAETEAPTRAGAVAEGAPKPTVRRDDYYFTREDLATALRMHPDTLKRRRQRGEILAPDVNEIDALERPQRVLWRRERVEAWIRDGAPKDVVRWDREYRRITRGN